MTLTRNSWLIKYGYCSFVWHYLDVYHDTNCGNKVGWLPHFVQKKSNTCITISEGMLCGKNCSCFTSTLCNKSNFANNLWDLLIAVYLCRETQWWLLAHHGVCAHLLVVGWHPLNSAHRILHVSPPPCHSYTRLIIWGPLWWNDKITFLILNKVYSCLWVESFNIRPSYVYTEHV